VSGANFVHGDLSAYNILVHDGAVWLIDFPQAVDPRTNANACALFHRDVDRLCRGSERFGVQADAARLSADLWRRFPHRADLIQAPEAFTKRLELIINLVGGGEILARIQISSRSARARCV
jgi:serine/threonine-protein kinase RIO1